MGQPAIPLNLTLEELSKLHLVAVDGDDGMEPDVILMVGDEALEESGDDQG